MKWVETMPTFSNTERTATLFIFNHIIAQFGVPQDIITNHGSHFKNFMMYELLKIWVFTMKTQHPITHKPMAKLKQ
jgi:hypothetical protein